MEDFLEKSTELLAGTPRIVEAALANISPTWLAAREKPDSYSPLDVVGHLIHGEEADWVVRIHHILDHGGKCPFSPFDPSGFKRKYGAWPIERLLHRFRYLREQNLIFVRRLNLQKKDLGRTGRHPEFGIVTMEQLVAAWVVHDLSHLNQIFRCMAKQYNQTVGPWKAYLRILNQ